MKTKIYVVGITLKTAEGKEYDGSGAIVAYRSRKSAMRAAVREAKELIAFRKSYNLNIKGVKTKKDGKQVIVTLPNVCSWTYRPYAIFLND